MRLWRRLTVVAVVAGALAVGILTTIEHGAVPPGPAVTGPGVEQHLDHSHEEGHSPPPSEDSAAGHFASASVTNAESIYPESRYTAPPLLAASLTFVAIVVAIAALPAVREVCGHRLRLRAKRANSAA